jgi:hypothetical protein
MESWTDHLREATRLDEADRAALARRRDAPRRRAAGDVAPPQCRSIDQNLRCGIVRMWLIEAG